MEHTKEQQEQQVQPRIRPVEPQDQDDIDELLRRCFTRVTLFFRRRKEQGFVADVDGEVEAVVLFWHSQVGGRRYGVVDYLCTHPDVQGAGIGRQMLAEAIDALDEAGCDEIITTIEGHNTASGRLFARFAFSPLSPGQQLSRFGRRLPRLWWHSGHVVHFGFLLWARPGDTRQSGPANLIVSAVVLAAIFAVAVWRNGHGEPAIAATAAATALLVFLRAAAAVLPLQRIQRRADRSVAAGARGISACARDCPRQAREPEAWSSGEERYVKKYPEAVEKS